MADSTTVRVKGLSLPLSIGVHDFERIKPQTVIISIDMRVHIVRKPPEDTPDFVSYDPIVEHLTALSKSGRHIDLVEQLADEIFDFVFTDPRVASATVEVMKPEIFEQAQAVGVLISRENPAA